MSGTVAKLFVNDRDVCADVCVSDISLTRLAGWSAGMTYERAIVHPVDSIGGLASPSFTVAERIIPIEMLINASSVSVRDSDVALMLDLFNPHHFLELRVADNLNKVVEGFCSRSAVTILDPSMMFAQGACILGLEVTCHNPSKRDRYARSVAFGATRTAIPLGTLPSYGTVYLMGSATTPTLTYRDASGNSIQTMTFATLGSTEYLAIDLENKTILKYTAGSPGTYAAGAALWTGGTPTAGWITTDPQHGSHALSMWPTLEVSSGAGLYIYRRTWDN